MNFKSNFIRLFIFKMCKIIWVLYLNKILRENKRKVEDNYIIEHTL